MARFGRRKKFETTDGFLNNPSAKRVETMARFALEKKFETTDGFPTFFHSAKSVETMARFAAEKS